MKYEVYKRKYFDKSKTFKWHGDFKKGCFSAELALKRVVDQKML